MLYNALMEAWLIQIIHFNPALTYFIIVFLSFVEGPILSMVCGLLVRLGEFPFWPVYIALMIGDLIGDIFWYVIGYKFGHKFISRFGKYFSITEEGVESVKKIFHKYKNHILLISKLTMGLGFAIVTLVTAGMVKIPFKSYMAMNLFGQVFWTALLLAIGYFLGDIYVQVDNILGKISVLALFIMIFIAMVGYGKYLKRRMSNI